MRILLVALGGASGAVLRYGVSGVVYQRWGAAFPVGTLAVNVIGCFAIGVLMGSLDTRWAVTPDTRLFLGVGLLGAFTTFSTFGYETLELMRAGSVGLAALNAGASVVLGVLAVAVGRALVEGLV